MVGTENSGRCRTVVANASGDPVTVKHHNILAILSRTTAFYTNVVPYSCSAINSCKLLKLGIFCLKRVSTNKLMIILSSGTK